MQDDGVTLLFERTDAARELNLSGGMIPVLVEQGVLRPAARTPRGVQLFTPEEVQRVKRERARRQRGRRRPMAVAV